MTRLMKANESIAARRRVYFLIVGTDGITQATGEAGGQPQISTSGGAWTNTGIGTLTHVGDAHYYAELTQAALANSGDNIQTRYKSANTAEIPGDSISVVGFDPSADVIAGVWNLSISEAPFIDPGTIGEFLVLYIGVIANDVLNTFSNTATIINRLGAFTGSGINTVLGFLQALARSDASVPSNMGGTYDPATHSLQAHLTSLFTRDLSTITGEAARSFLNALRVLRNKTAISGTTLTVYEEDDTTTAWTATLSSDSGAAPVTGVDPL